MIENSFKLKQAVLAVKKKKKKKKKCVKHVECNT